MKIENSKKIEGLKILTPEVFHDFRGEYLETYNEEKYQLKDSTGALLRFVEDDISISRQHVLRGLHGDGKTWKLIQCLYGELYYVIADMRKDSPSYMQWEGFTVNDRNKMQVLVPAGCVNGYLALSEKCIFSYKQSEYYSGMNKQITVRWNDPALNIFWPVHHPILSQRDSEAIDIKDWK